MEGEQWVQRAGSWQRGICEQREMRQREVRWEKLMGGRRGEQKMEGNKEEMKKGETTAVSITKQK